MGSLKTDPSCSLCWALKDLREKLGTEPACLQGVHDLLREEVNMPKVQYKVQSKELREIHRGMRLRRQRKSIKLGYSDTKRERLEI